MLLKYQEMLGLYAPALATSAAYVRDIVCDDPSEF